jgi:predicted acylesterase/phospholipase RssA
VPEPALLDCDLVMKGGITSGIVYPAAILRLKGRYRFRNIGGTSAGAMAAALTAAAEYGRTVGALGFPGLADASAELGTPGLLLGLFQPERKTRGVFRFLLLLKTGPSAPRRLPLGWLLPLHLALARSVPVSYTAGLLLALLIGAIVIFAWASGHPLSGWGWGSYGIAGLLVLFIGLILAPIVPLWRLGRSLVDEVPANCFGLCSGLREAVTGKPAVTDWLHEKVQTLAGLSTEGVPLTFDMLWNAGRKPPDPSSPPIPQSDRVINLQVVTSCLSQGQPYTLPFDGDVFAFKQDELARLLPPPVIAHLMANGATERDCCELPDGYRYLPEAGRLPVVMAARMSLSFPLLFSAVPLYAIRHDRAIQARKRGVPVRLDPATDLQRLWFSDGGICSNFPIHFFDNWLPRRPTFGISLTDLPQDGIRNGRVSQQYMSYAANQWRGAPPKADDGHHAFYQSVYLPRPDDQQSPEWTPFTTVPTDPSAPPSLFKFLTAIFTTAQNYRDNTQSLLPSYRERVVQVRLEESEGGLNLAMDSKTIAKIVQKGEEAGEVLCEHFDFRRHQWVRFRVLMGRLEERLAVLREVLRDERFDFSRLVGEQLGEDGSPFPYSLPEPWPNSAVARTEELLTLLDTWQRGGLVFDQSSPEPKPTLRVMPQG